MAIENKGERTPHWAVWVRPRSAQLDAHGRDVLSDIRQLGFTDVRGVAASKLYFLAGTLSAKQVAILADELLSDRVVEIVECLPVVAQREDSSSAIEVHTLPGVMDPVALSTLAAAKRLLAKTGAGEDALENVWTARRYVISGTSGASELEQIAARVLAHGCIERWYIQCPDRHDALPGSFPKPTRRAFALRHVELTALADGALGTLSREGHLFLALEEMRAIRNHFRRLGREPTDLELETLAQTWSEHCVHKTLKSAIDYRGDDFGRPGAVSVHFDNLLKDTIVAATSKLNRDWCLSLFVDNAGVMEFDDEYGIAFKVETHNHPSAIEPYGGSATGVGGCIRDIMGCGLGAKPIASTDVFCLAPPGFDARKLPRGVLHPRRVLKGVVSGVRDYGNRMGIPTVNGAIHFDERYLANPLVFCGCVGLIPKNRITKAPRTGDLIVLAGGRTGRDGIHGATFSSAELNDSAAGEFAHAVQIGNAIEEKKLLDAELLAREHPDGCLYSAVTDCGAGGLSSAVGEMGERLGAAVNLETVPLKYEGLRYDEIWISEAQERMVFAVPPERLDEFMGVFAREEVEATVIGKFASDRVLRVRYEDTTVCELDMEFLHNGIPKFTRSATWTAGEKQRRESGAAAEGRTAEGGNKRLLRELGSLNTASREWVIRQYDHEVQGRSVIKPLCGPGVGPSDAAVIRPRYESKRGIAIGCGLCPELGDVDPYLMAIASVDEALRNVICVGANPQRTAILDNFCWPKVDTEESLGALVRACRGAHDAAVAFGLPFISGKDSLNNEFTMCAEEAESLGLPRRIAIPYTLLISALGIVDDVSRCVSMDLKRHGNLLVLASAPVERVGLHAAAELHLRVAQLIKDGKVVSAHDVSDGGVAVAAAEMCIAGAMGAALEFDNSTIGDSPFSMAASTYVLEMAAADAQASGLPVLGRVDETPRLRIDNGEGPAIDLAVEELARAWREPLAHGGGS